MSEITYAYIVPESQVNKAALGKILIADFSRFLLEDLYTVISTSTDLAYTISGWPEGSDYLSRYNTDYVLIRVPYRT